MNKLTTTGERLEFFHFSNVTVEHLHRYSIASDYVKNKVVLDIASGEGYGSYLLSIGAKFVTGVDIDRQTIENAIDKYKKSNLKFLEGSVESIPVKSKSIDIVVSFETLEHHDLHDEMFIEIIRVLKPGGSLIMSSPDKKYYSDLPCFKNKFHVKELYFEDFKKLTRKYFKNTQFYFQKAYNLNSYIFNKQDFENIIIFSGDNQEMRKDKFEPLYNIVIASDKEISILKPSIFNGERINELLISNIVNKTAKHHLESIKNSYSYKIGDFLLYPILYLKKILKKN